MQDRPGPVVPAARFAVIMAELVHRLRHVASGFPLEERLLPDLPRLLSAAALVRALGQEAQQPALRAAGEAAAALGASLPTAGADLAAGLDRLCTWLETILERADAGAAAAELAREPRWETVAEALAAADTPAALLAALADDLSRWSAVHGDSELTPEQEAALTRRWREIRRFGDALFHGRGSLLGRLLERDPP